MALLAQEREQVVGRARPEHLAGLERQLERRRPEVGEQDVEVVRIEARLLGRALEQELRVVDDVLVDRRARGDEDRDAGPGPPPGPAELLPRRRRSSPGSRPGSTTSSRPMSTPSSRAFVATTPRISPSRRPRSIARRSVGQVAAAIAADPRPRAVALAERLAQPGQEQLDRDARPPEHDRLAAGPQERQRPALGQGHGRAAGAARRVEHRRIDEQDVALAGRRPVAVVRTRTGRPVSASASSPGFPIVAEQQTITGWLP